jgi:hypothetical protein
VRKKRAGPQNFIADVRVDGTVNVKSHFYLLFQENLKFPPSYDEVSFFFLYGHPPPAASSSPAASSAATTKLFLF